MSEIGLLEYAIYYGSVVFGLGYIVISVWLMLIKVLRVIGSHIRW